MALSFIGKPISLISHSDVRYKGILAGIDAQASTIQLSNVYSMGTESRRSPAEFIPPVQEAYEYIIFRAAEVKDLAVEEAAPPSRSVHDDPAVLGASAPITGNFVPYPATVPAPPVPVQQQPPQPQQGYAARPPQQQQPNVAPPSQQQQPPAQAILPTQVTAAAAPTTRINQTRRPNPVHTAAASLETVERALGDLRVSSTVNGHTTHHHPGRGGGRRGGHHHGGRGGHRDLTEQLKVPTTDFDFESSNAKFDKAALSPVPSKDTNGNTNNNNGSGAEGDSASSDSGDGGKEKKDKEKEKEKPAVAYNPQKSFFDTLSSGASVPSEGSRVDSAGGGGGGAGGRGRRGGGGGVGRNRREEEREKNVATFGEPGGVGLMGPGAYVGGWGGYGRRGGGRPRRGGGRGGGHAGSNQAQPVPAPAR